MYKRNVSSVVGTLIDRITWSEAIGTIDRWAKDKIGRVVCICNVHSVVTAKSDSMLAKALNEADMATPDGAPVAWLISRTEKIDQQRINGPDLMWKYFQHAQDHSQSVFLYGSSIATLTTLKLKLSRAFPNLIVAGVYSPPFRPLTEQEDDAVVNAINSSGARTVWVSLGCPKQEIWMNAHREKVKAVMIGVGAAFDYHAGTVARAPIWMQNNGLEWLFRLISEPRRLWRRYLVTNSLFIWYAISQIIHKNKNSRDSVF